MALDGNYNIQVLQEALKRFGDFECVRVENPTVMATTTDITQEQAFICHTENHWIAIRQLHGQWFNLNSLNREPGPEIVSSFYLAALLDSITQMGSTTVRGHLFVIRGTSMLPMPNPGLNSSPGRGQYYIDLEMLKEIASGKPGKRSGNTQIPQPENPEPEKEEFKAFTGAGVSLSAGTQYAEVNAGTEDFLAAAMQDPGMAEDPELAWALKMSMEEQAKEAVQRSVPEEPSEEEPSAVTVCLRLIDGSKAERRFLKSHTIEDIVNYARTLIKDLKYKICVC